MWVGPCIPGTQTCVAGSWPKVCSGEILPSAEACDGKDNDCDGLVDESLARNCTYGGPGGTEGVGLCRAASQSCSVGNWSPCIGEVRPAAKEVCRDQKDNDCNGLVDDGCCQADKIDGTKVRDVFGHTDKVNAVAVSPSGKTVATGSDDKTVILWDTATGAARARLTEHVAAVTCLDYSPNGKMLVSGSLGRKVIVWNSVSYKKWHELTGQTSAAMAVAFAQDNKTVAVGLEDGTIRLWDVSGPTPGRVLRGHEGPVTGVAFGPHGTVLFSASADRTARTWRVSDGAPVKVYGPGGTATTAACKADNDCTGGFCFGGLCRTPDGAAGHVAPLTSVSIDSTGNRFVTGSADKAAMIWTVGTAKPSQTIKGHTNAVLSVAWTVGSEVVTGSMDKTAKVWDLSGAKPKVLQTLTGHREAVSSVAWRGGEVLGRRGGQGRWQPARWPAQAITDR